MPRRHVALAVLVTVIWGANFVVIDEGLGDIPPTLFVAMRFVVVLIPAIFLVPRPAMPWRDVVRIGAFMSLGQFGLLYTGLAVGMPAGLASLVLQAQVVATVIIASLVLHERPSRTQVIGVGIGLLGLVVVGVGRSAATAALGLLFVIAAALSWAIGNVAARRAAAQRRGNAVPIAVHRGDHFLAQRMVGPGRLEEAAVERLVADRAIGARGETAHHRGRDVAWPRPHRNPHRHQAQSRSISVR